MADQPGHDDIQLIDALVDGEMVDAARLKEALLREAAVDYLVDALALRDVVTANVATGFPAGSPLERRTLRSVGRASGARRLTAAAALMLAAAAGFLAGAWAPTTSNTSAVAEKAPAPTRVIELEAGVNWTESGGM